MLNIRPKVKDWNRWITAIDNVHKRAVYYHNWVPRVMSIEFKNRLTENLMSERFSYMYNAYHPDYEKYKKEQVGHLKFWVFKGLVLKGIENKKLSSGPGKATWFAGLDNILTDEDGSPVVKYAILMEKGGPLAYRRFIPSRPLFGPTHEGFIKSSFPTDTMKKTWLGMKSQWK